MGNSKEESPWIQQEEKKRKKKKAGQSLPNTEKHRAGQKRKSMALTRRMPSRHVQFCSLIRGFQYALNLSNHVVSVWATDCNFCRKAMTKGDEEFQSSLGFFSTVRGLGIFSFFCFLVGGGSTMSRTMDTTGRLARCGRTMVAVFGPPLADAVDDKVEIRRFFLLLLFLLAAEKDDDEDCCCTC